jgi:dGTPase
LGGKQKKEVPLMQNPLEKGVYLRRSKEREVDIRGDFFRDQTAIIHSMPYRRLKHKTQVFFSPENDHVCTRIEHVQHVATIAATICKGLNQNGWNLDLEMAYAIGLGHDLGHAPFGHAGERALSESLGFEFIHEINSYRVAQYLANNGEGLNLTYGVNDGIICHNGESFEQTLKPMSVIKNLDGIKDRKSIPSSFEGCIVRFSDKIAYLGRDIEDALLANMITEDDIPQNVKKALGKKNGEIINSLVVDIIDSSAGMDCITFSDSSYRLVQALKQFNYEKIYRHKILSDYEIFAKRIITTLYNYIGELLVKYKTDYDSYCQEPTKLSANFGSYLKKMDGFYYQVVQDKNLFILMDYISGMTDDYALWCMQNISIPKPITF